MAKPFEASFYNPHSKMIDEALIAMPAGSQPAARVQAWRAQDHAIQGGYKVWAHPRHNMPDSDWLVMVRTQDINGRRHVQTFPNRRAAEMWMLATGA